MVSSGIELLTAYVNLAANSTVQADVKRDLVGVEKSAQDSGKRIGSHIGGGISTAVKAAGGLLAGAGAGKFVADSIAGARESNRVAAITENAIKATGGAAKISATQVGELAGAISKKTGIDDEAIQSGANLLLTFKNVRNEVGAGNDIFNQATAAAQDMAAAGFGSADGAAKMLGKALNDPIKGMSALSRAGVTFTAAQKDQVAAMVEAGDVLGAQKIIMQEVQGQVGGAAEAAATSGDKARTAFGNLQETLGAKLLPIIDSTADGLTGFITGMEDGTGAGGKFADILETVWSAGEKVVDFLDRNQDVIIPLAGGILAMVGAWKAYQIATGIAAGAQALLNTVMEANPIGIVVLAVVGLTTALILAYKKSETFRDIVNGAWDAVSSGAKWMWNEVLRPVFKGLVNGFFWVADKILAGAEKAFGWVPGIGDKLKGARKKFAEFKDSVNDSLQRIDDKTVNVGIDFKPGSKIYYAAKHMGLATGGHVAFADGGITPGYTPGRDVHTFFSPTGGILELSGGEPVLRPEAGLVLGHSWVDGINAAARAGGVGGVQRFLGAFAGGGVIPRAWLPSYSTVDRGVGTESLRSIGSAVQKLKSSFVVPGVGSGVQRWAGVALQAMAMAGLPASYLPLLLYRMNVESGGNPAAINLWDINAKNGTPSMGLMQTILPTFNAFAGPLRGLGVWNPLANIYAAIMYTLSRYGLSGIGRAWGGTAGYKDGGFIGEPFVADSGVTLAPGLNVVNNKLGKPEPLARTDQPIELGPQTRAFLEDVLRDALRIDGRALHDSNRRYAAREVPV